jgi:hypothetical protein
MKSFTKIFASVVAVLTLVVQTPVDPVRGDWILHLPSDDLDAGCRRRCHPRLVPQPGATELSLAVQPATGPVTARSRSALQFRKINEWVKLYTSLIFSFWLSGSFVTGSALISHRSWAEAIGAGLVAGSTFATVIWRRSPLTKGMELALASRRSKDGD